MPSTSYKCPNCGANIPFDAQSGTLRCAYCGTQFDFENLQAFNVEQNVETEVCDWNISENQTIKLDGKICYVCPSCGGEVIGDETTSSTYCPYCGTAIILKEQLSGMLEPDYIIPFKLTKEDAKNKYCEHIKGKLLLPNDFKINNIIQKLNGVYVPYWLYDADTTGQARFRATRTRHYMQGDYQITETSYYMVYRDGRAMFEKVPVDASVRLDDALLDSLEPFDYHSATNFNTAYLSNYLADKYDQEKEECAKKANIRIKNSLTRMLQNSVVGYDSVMLMNSSIQFHGGKASYALLPVYLITSQYNGKVYQFAMNGQTGKFVGDLPMDKSKAIFYSLVTFMISFGVIFLVCYLMGKGA